MLKKLLPTVVLLAGGTFLAVGQYFGDQPTVTYTGGGGGSFNNTNAVFNGMITIHSINGDFDGGIDMTNRAVIYWRKDTNSVGASIYYEPDHDSIGAGELQFASYHNFSFTDDLDGSSAAYSHFGQSGHSHGIWGMQYDEDRITNGFPRGFSHYWFYSAKYWNTITSSALNHNAGWRYEIKDNTTTNGALVWYGKLRAWSQVQTSPEVANVTTANLNDDGTWNMTGLNVTNNSNIGTASGSSTTIGDNLTGGVYLKGAAVNLGLLGVNSITQPEILVQSGQSAGTSFIEFGRKSPVSGDSTRFSFNDRTGVTIFRIERSGGGGYWNAGGFTFGGTTIIANTLDSSAMFFKYKANVVGKTANYTVTAADAGTRFCNDGATGTITNTLPTAAVGLTYVFTVVTGQPMTVRAAAGEIIQLSGSASSLGGGIAQAGNNGASVTLTCYKAGFWHNEALTGTWTGF